MLTTDQLNTVLNKDILKLEDLLLLEDHLLFIQKLEQENVDLPQDVIFNLNMDVELILDCLKKHRIKMHKPKLTLISNN
jgi:hypothetical protein